MSPRRKAGEASGPTRELVTTRLTTDAKKRLNALSQVTGEPAYRHLEQGFWLLWENLPQGERTSAEAFIKLVDEARAKHKKNQATKKE